MSIDTAPFGLSLPQDSSPAARARNAALNIGQRERLQGLQELFIEQLSSLGAQNPGYFIDAGTGLPDRYIQMCIPELDYPRSDLPPNVCFAGGLPRGSRDPSTTFPPIWDEITRISQTKEKKIVEGSQGTFATLPTQLLLPTISALGQRPDILVVAILGSRNASLPPDVTIPSNVRVADFIPCDGILLHCDLFVTNGWIWSFTARNCKWDALIVAGGSEDKPETAARVQWAGIGVDLRTDTPTEAVLREAVERVLEDVSIKKNIMRLKMLMEKHDPIGFIADQIMECSCGVGCASG
jgi:UDP:flavonoid glycosyltransferase YjiC (YdhE family)